jgi:hypothetical protein
MELTLEEKQRYSTISAVCAARTIVQTATTNLAGLLGALNRLAANGADVERELAAVERAYVTLSDDVLSGLNRTLGQ